MEKEYVIVESTNEAVIVESKFNNTTFLTEKEFQQKQREQKQKEKELQIVTMLSGGTDTKLL
jgi:hypothetical protein